MKPIRIFRHIDCEGPGYLLDVLERYGIPFELVRIDAGETVPEDIADISGIVIMGGSMSANDDLEWIEKEQALVQQAAEAGMPVLGHCLGGQIMAKALGAKVVMNSIQEIGWFTVDKLAGAAADDWLEGVDLTAPVFHWHGEMFEIPKDAHLILGNQHCSHQGFVKGNMLALQCHIEMTEELVKEWATRFADQITPGSESVNNPEAMLDNLSDRIRHLNAMADKIYTRWLQPILKDA